MRFAFGPFVTVTIHTPGTPTTDPVTGNDIPGADTSYVCDEALLSDSSAGQDAVEQLANGTTVMSTHQMLVPETISVPPNCWVEFEGSRFEVVGRNAFPRSFQPPIPVQLVSLKYISDLQE